MAIGYIELDDWLPFRKIFAYMDASDQYRVDELFRKYKLRARFKNERVTSSGRYKIVFCTIPKNQVHLFKKAMEELPSRMHLLGYEDYADAWKALIISLEDNDVMATLN